MASISLSDSSFAMIYISIHYKAADRNTEENVKQRERKNRSLLSALGGNRTHTPFDTRPSTVPVYQFQHQR